MAAVAVCYQQRTNVLFEKRDAFRAGRSLRGQDQRSQKTEDAEHFPPVASVYRHGPQIAPPARDMLPSNGFSILTAVRGVTFTIGDVSTQVVIPVL
jgi:hypothetical protein